MFLRDNKMAIRNTTRDDAKLLCDWWNDGAVMAHAGFPNGLGTTELAVTEMLSKDSDDKGRRLIIELDSVPIGEMSYSNVGNSSVEIGIKICDFDNQEKGFGTLFLKMLIEELFDMGYMKVILDTNLNNKRAQHIYSKLGFKQLGVRKDVWVDQFGVPQSLVDYELSKTEFIG